MAHPETQEERRLEHAAALIDAALGQERCRPDARLSLLEALSCKRSGLAPDEYRKTTGYSEAFACEKSYLDEINAAIEESGIRYSMALSALARIEDSEVETKRNGAVYTDFRLATYLASAAMHGYVDGAIIDPACGTSIVLCACAEWVYNTHGRADEFVANRLYGVDLSEYAIRGSILALASYIDCPSDLKLLVSHFICDDSLALGGRLTGRFGLSDFALVVGNPPWERVRPSRNEYARGNGVIVNYGNEIKVLPDGYEQHRDESRRKSLQLSAAYGLKGGMDLYRAFLNLAIAVCCDGGSIALYLPAGLIRSKSLAPVRAAIINDFGTASLSVFMNRSKFFGIDTRFKFVLALLAEKHRPKEPQGVEFRYCDADDEGVYVASKLRLEADMFCDKSGELGAPEVKNDDEVAMLRDIWHHSTRMKEHRLFGGVRPVRELDMTLDRPLFKRATNVQNAFDSLPLIEGRMVSQYRCGCKEYLSGSGRSAKWGAVPLGSSRIKPQFYVARDDIDSDLCSRFDTERIGFCDIAGQTNERAMQAAFVPAGCACGNKVPTLLFGNRDTAMLWLGIANSLVFDWVVRRYITTTINFFILGNLPLPNFEDESKIAARIIESVRRILELEDGNEGWGREEAWLYAKERAALDAYVLEAYGLDVGCLNVILKDFPLIDQANMKIAGGTRPTIELVRSAVADDSNALNRARAAFDMGALPYVPNEHMRSMLR